MKKILLTLALAFGAMIAIPTVGSAQKTTETQKKECTKECTKDKAACKAHKGDCKGTECAKKECKSEECAKANCKDCKNACGNDCKQQAKKGQKGEKKGRIESKINPGMQVTGKRNGNPLFNGITLTPEQQVKMKALKEKRHANHEKLKADKKIAKADRRAEFKKEAEAFEKEVENILTPDQLKKYNENKEALKKEKKAQR